ncbi:hypothetical protein CYMTET_12292 [Cymbomonas tetramitiformis]|uniref:DNA-directed DNA polymerase family A palm domain-containing protein n=1 Tax=Cymbomonas tetramitiformis TaxID=36881 RepID=A0AAE0GKW7_9CHLO|nr:hypothetical protein CYMTET_12292 [Cymbomonas tetramitiformis]
MNGLVGNACAPRSDVALSSQELGQSIFAQIQTRCVPQAHKHSDFILQHAPGRSARYPKQLPSHASHVRTVRSRTIARAQQGSRQEPSGAKKNIVPALPRHNSASSAFTAGHRSDAHRAPRREPQDAAPPEVVRNAGTALMYQEEALEDLPVAAAVVVEEDEFDFDELATPQREAAPERTSLPGLNSLKLTKANGIEVDFMNQHHTDNTGPAPALIANETPFNLLHPPDVLVVNTVDVAQAVLKQLQGLAQEEWGHDDCPRYHALDTEVMDIDVKKQTPVGHGRVICLSAYCGPDVNFLDSLDTAMLHRLGFTAADHCPKLWIQTWSREDPELGERVLQVFKGYLENPQILKVWHNYSFDRHVLGNHGIDVQGLGGDTLHMARLWDSSREGAGGGYSLAALSKDPRAMKFVCEGEDAYHVDTMAKTSMKELFGRRNIKKDGTEGKMTVLPPMEELQEDRAVRCKWIEYSCKDAEATWYLRESLEAALRSEQCRPCPVLCRDAKKFGTPVTADNTLWDYYISYWRPFGELLTELEKEGMMVDKVHLAGAQLKAEAEQSEAEKRFRDWAMSFCEDAKYMNVGSGPQVRQLLFAGARNKRGDKEAVPMERVFNVPNVDGLIEEGKKVAKKNMQITLYGLGIPIAPTIFTASGVPAVSAPALRDLAGNPGHAHALLQKVSTACLCLRLPVLKSLPPHVGCGPCHVAACSSGARQSLQLAKWSDCCAPAGARQSLQLGKWSDCCAPAGARQSLQLGKWCLRQSLQLAKWSDCCAPPAGARQSLQLGKVVRLLGAAVPARACSWASVRLLCAGWCPSEPAAGQVVQVVVRRQLGKWSRRLRRLVPACEPAAGQGSGLLCAGWCPPVSLQLGKWSRLLCAGRACSWASGSIAVRRLVPARACSWASGPIAVRRLVRSEPAAGQVVRLLCAGWCPPEPAAGQVVRLLCAGWCPPEPAAGQVVRLLCAGWSPPEPAAGQVVRLLCAGWCPPEPAAGQVVRFAAPRPMANELRALRAHLGKGLRDASGQSGHIRHSRSFWLAVPVKLRCRLWKVFARWRGRVNNLGCDAEWLCQGRLTAGVHQEAGSVLRIERSRVLDASENPATKQELLKEAEDKCGGKAKAFDAFNGGREGLSACSAIDALCEMAAIDTLLSNFIIPLQGSDLRGRGDRIHCSLNINTETGRLSCRRPNMQNQPAMEKDRYGVRKAFNCEEGNSLIVCDYGQLELRLLAHMTECKSMMEAFELGGDFHSRTALGMFKHIQDAVADGTCLLEWDGGENYEPPPVPLLKDMFGSERRKAKILNFSIAYGKTAHGLSRDWGVTLKEAQATVDLWYSDRPEVEEWQKNTKAFARQEGYVTTLLGRRRHLPDAVNGSNAAKGHAERAAINTPIQGGAADIAMLAMLQIQGCKRLQKLGFKLLMQVHDEVILEGPTEHVEEALDLVRKHMENPFPNPDSDSGFGCNPLLVALNVDGKFEKTWYEAK